MDQDDDNHWYPLPEDLIVQLIAIERRAVRKHPGAPPVQPARVIWEMLIRRDDATHARHELQREVMNALEEDGGQRIYPMIEISASRLNAAVELVTGGLRVREGQSCGPDSEHEDEGRMTCRPASESTTCAGATPNRNPRVLAGQSAGVPARSWASSGRADATEPTECREGK